MAELSPQLAAALRGERPLLVGIVEINLPGYDLLLLDGAAELMIGGRKFVGRDPTYGVLSTIKGLADSLGDQAPAVTLGFNPPSKLAIAKLLDPHLQGSPVRISVDCVDIATGRPTGAGYTLFAGELDVPTIAWDANDQQVEFKVTSNAERLFATEEGLRLSDAAHQRAWPGELGLAFVTDVKTIVPWGQKLDTTAVTIRTDIPSIGAITSART